MKSTVVRVLLIAAAILASGSSFAATDFELRSLKDLERFIRRNRIESIDAFLAKLPLELRKRYHLIHKTRGLQHATEEFPRVLLSTFQNDLTLSFSTDPSHPSYGEIELFEYDPRAKDFNFQTIRFSNVTDVKPRISKPNPEACLACHRNSATGKNRPIWDHAYAWSGFYGGLFDIHSWNNGRDGSPGRKTEYVNGEKLAYDRYVYPRLERDGLFKHLPKDLFTDLNWYMFRAPAESPVSTNFSILNSRANTDAFLKHMQRRNRSVDRIGYALVVAELCSPDLDNGSALPREPTVQELYDFGKTFLDPQTLDRLIVAGSREIGVPSGADPVSTLANTVEFLREKTASAVRAKTESVCREQNDLLARMGSSQTIDCRKPFTSSLAGIDANLAPYVELFNQMDVYAHRYNITGHLFLALIFKALDFPYEHWSASRTPWKSWTTHNQGRENISYSLLTRPFVARDYPELAEHVKKATRNELKEKYSNFFLEIPNFPAHYTDLDALNQKGFCKAMAERSRRYAKGYF